MTGGQIDLFTAGKATAGMVGEHLDEGRNARAEFLAGMLATWTIGDRKPTPIQTRAFRLLAEKTLTEALLARGTVGANQ